MLEMEKSKLRESVGNSRLVDFMNGMQYEVKKIFGRNLNSTGDCVTESGYEEAVDFSMMVFNIMLPMLTKNQIVGFVNRNFAEYIEEIR